MADAPTANMGLVLPTEDSAVDAGDWDRLINVALRDRVDIHTHAAGLGKQVPSAGIGIDADLTFAGFRVTNIAGVALTALGAALTSGAREIFTFGGDLYYRNASGANVQVTSGATINASAIGGIGGDYAGKAALLDFDDGTDTYRFRQEVSAAVRQFAKVASADLLLYEYKAAGATPVPTNAVTLKSPAALAGSYSLTMPAALPGSDALLQATTAGVLSASNTLTNLLTCSGGVVTGEGDIRHATAEEPIAIHACPSSAGTRSQTKIAHGSGFTVWMPITGRVGSKIVSARMRLNDLGGAGWAGNLYKMTVSTRSVTVIAAASGSTGDAWWTATPGTPETIATDTVYFFEAVSGAAGGEAYGGSASISRG